MEAEQKKWTLIVDVEKCENCNNCYMTLLDEYVDNTFPKYSEPCPRHGHHWIQLETHERGQGSLMDVAYLFSTCNQCDNAPCIKAAKNSAIYKRADGIVMIDPETSKGQKDLVKACPYGNIWWNEELEIPQKWSWDAHLLDVNWKEPRPVSVCATGCLKAIALADTELKEIIIQEKLETLYPEFNTKPRLYYKNLYRFNKEHIAGSIAKKENNIEDVVVGAQIILLKDNKEIRTCTTDAFGDFKFDAISPNSGEYQIKIIHTDQEKEMSHNMEQSINLGVIYL